MRLNIEMTIIPVATTGNILRINLIIFRYLKKWTSVSSDLNNPDFYFLFERVTRLNKSLSCKTKSTYKWVFH